MRCAINTFPTAQPARGNALTPQSAQAAQLPYRSSSVRRYSVRRNSVGRNSVKETTALILSAPGVVSLHWGPVLRLVLCRVLGGGLLLMLLTCALSPASAQMQDAVPTFDELDSIEARVQGCVTCHGQRGQGTANGYFPRIAGKPAGYLYNQLLAFKNGTRHYSPMNYLVAYLPEAYLREIAEYFAKEQPPFAAQTITAAEPSVVARGAQLALKGDPDKVIPACITCHGERLTGMEPGIPGLIGLRPTYIIAQLTRWQVGDRHALEPDCMKRIASRLSNDDVVAVAAWLSRQQAPKNLSPESSNLIRMPFACGSQPRT